MKKTILLFFTALFCFSAMAQDGPSSFYKTNPTFGQKVYAPIVIDGNPSEWSEDMLIVQGVANDDPRAFRGAHEGPVYDLYQLYAAWDDINLYLMWQITNVSDIASPTQDYPHSDNGKPWNGDIPFQIAFDIIPGEGSNGMLSANATEGVSASHIWGVFNVFPDNNVDKMLMFSSKPGVGQPGVFSLNPTSGFFSYDNVDLFNQAGVEYKWGDYCVPTEIWGIPQDEHIDFGYQEQFIFVPEDLEDESLYVDFMTHTCPTTGKKHDSAQETVYEMKIPLIALGIDVDYLENNGIGIMLISTFGESGTNSLPFDPTTLDNATTPYGPDESSSAEKNDVDHFTAPFARIGKESGATPVVRPTLSVSPKGGTYLDGVQVSIAASGENTPISIYYTLDGTSPSETSTLYTGPVNILSNATLKAIAIDSEGVKSVISSENYITEAPQPSNGIKIAFYPPEAGWNSETVKLWAWTASDDLFPLWPGIDMTKDPNGWFTYTFDESITSVSAIFSNGSGYQSVDIENIQASTCYEKLAENNEKFTVKSVDCPQFTGISESAEDFVITVYPNPAENFVQLNLSCEMNQLYFFSVTGSLVRTIENYAAKEEIDVSSLPQGVYFIQINGCDNMTKVVKFIKK